MNFFLAQAAPPPGGGGMTPAILTLLPWLLFIVVFYYFFVAAPMKKKQKAFQTLMSNLKSGDRVITNSGMFGVVTGITDKTVKLRIANNVVVDFEKSAIAGLAPEETKEEKK
ncbi:preprotein translocase subunit YajC [bacterium]|jgi:preprotein translocase subunit YajC|nr:preprotein translocase subunit YajC [bacterium]